MFRFFNARYALVGASLYFVAATTNALAEPKSLSLATATSNTLQNHPHFRQHEWQVKARQAQAVSAGLSPELRIQAQAENILGSGSTSGLNQGQTTVAISSVLEMGDKLSARTNEAQAAVILTESEHYVDALKIVGRLTRQYIKTLAQQQRLALASERVGLAQDALKLVSERVNRSATPPAERYRAKAAVYQAKLDEAAAAAQLKIEKHTLTLFWRSAASTPEFSLEGTLNSPGVKQNFSQIYNQFLSSAHNEHLEKAIELEQARVALAKSADTPDVSWQVGVRRLQNMQDTALVASVSVPLFSQQRNRGAVAAAKAAEQVTYYAQTIRRREVKQILFQAFETQKLNHQRAEDLHKYILPNLSKALAETRTGYQQGIYNYQDWLSALQAELEAKATYINYAESALLNQALIEQWTGNAMHTPHAPHQQSSSL